MIFHPNFCRTVEYLLTWNRCILEDTTNNMRLISHINLVTKNFKKPICGSQRSLEPILAIVGQRQDHSPIAGPHTDSRTQTLTKATNPSVKHVGLWEEAGVPGEIPPMLGKTSTEWTQQGFEPETCLLWRDSADGKFSIIFKCWMQLELHLWHLYMSISLFCQHVLNFTTILVF